jgi:hypothetical protein
LNVITFFPETWPASVIRWASTWRRDSYSIEDTIFDPVIEIRSQRQSILKSIQHSCLNKIKSLTDCILQNTYT